ncbi:MAG: hypothetical protein ABFS14_01530 [Gemmatimonadota bacterium]
MQRELRNSLLGLLLVGGLAACSENPVDPTAGTPGTNTGAVAEPSIVAPFEVQVAADETTAEVVTEDVALSLSSPTQAAPSEGAGTPFAEARLKFAAARAAYRLGDEEAARALALEARLILAAALIDHRGEEGLDALFARVEHLIDRIQEADDEFAQLDRLEDKLEELVEQARALQAEGDLVGAAERLLLGLQITDVVRHRHRDFRLEPATVARFSIARAVEALELARGLIGDAPTFKQERVLFHVEELIRRAVFAAEHEAYRRAVVLARRAESRALLAVLECERPSEEDVRILLDLADSQIAEAEAAIGEDPTPAQQAILTRARRLKAVGQELIANGVWRGVALFWHSAVTAGVLF